MRTHDTYISVVVLVLAGFAPISCSDDGGGIVYSVDDAGKSDPDSGDAMASPDAPSALLAPTISPSGGTYEYTTPVTMSSEPGTKIYFSVNDESPVANGQISPYFAVEYKQPYAFPVREIDVIYIFRAVAATTTEPIRISPERIVSLVISAVPAAKPPTISPATGTYTSPLMVSILPGTPGDSVRYTIDGGKPTRTLGTLSTGDAFLVTATTTVKAIAYSEKTLSSPVVEATYTIPTAPTATPGTGAYSATQLNVTLATVTSGAVICYTTDGVTPACLSAACDPSAKLYASAIALVPAPGTQTIKAIACLASVPSAVMTSLYSVSGPQATKQAQPITDLPSGTIDWGARPSALAASGATILITKTVDGSTPDDPATTSGSTGVMSTCVPLLGVVATTNSVDLSNVVGLTSQGLNGLKRHAKYKLRACKVGDAISDVTSVTYEVKLPSPTLWSNATASVSAPAFGNVHQALNLFFKSEASGVASTDGAAAEGGLCIGTSAAVPSCASSGLACGSTTNTVWLPASSLRDPEGTRSAIAYAVWDGTGANDYNASERRQFNVVACRPDALSSAANPGTWTFKLNLAAYLGDSAGLPANPQLTAINLGVDLASESLSPTAPATSAAPGHVVFGLWNTSTTGTSYAALSASGALTSSTSAMPAGIAVYYTEDGPTPVPPTQCGDATAGPTWKAESSGATPHMNFPYVWSHPSIGTPVRGVACAPNWTTSDVASLILTVAP